MQKRIAKNLFVLLLLAGGLLFARLILAADFGTNEVANGLGGALSASDPRTIIGRIINVALGILGTIALGLIIWSGFIWMTSNGDEDKIKKAKQILKNGIIGLVIILSSWAIATFILTQLGGAINPPVTCVENDWRYCQCDGKTYCQNGAWGACENNDPENCSTPPISCNANPDPLGECQPYDNCTAGYFCDKVCLCQPKGESGDSCDADLANLRCDPDNNLCSNYLTCDPLTCLCAGPPVITNFSPVGGFCDNNPEKPCALDEDCGGDNCNLTAPNGAKNNFITIFGKGFGEYSSTSSQVIFLGEEDPKIALAPYTINPLCINFWSDDQIIVAVPPGVQTGPIKVINKDSLSDTTNDDYGPHFEDFIANNINRPGLCFINPSKGVLSSEVAYQGINLFNGEAYFGNYAHNVSALASNFSDHNGLSGTSTVPNIKSGNSGSFVEKLIAGFPQKSNYLKFTKEKEIGEGPYIMSFTPPQGTVGQYVTIKGAGFGNSRDNNHVYFANVNSRIEASYLFPAICANSVWKDNQVIVKVPSGLINDNYLIQMVLGTTTISTENLHPNSFTFGQNFPLLPSLCKIDPEQGPIDTPVSLWGEYFGAKDSYGTVRFNSLKDAKGLITKEKDASDMIQVTVPKDAVTGPVKVVKNGNEGNELSFLVGECTKNEECDNAICCPANTYKKGRCVASINECFIDVPTSVFEWGFSTNFDSTTTPPFDSCAGLAKYLGSCYQGNMCPNAPGACSSPAVSYPKNVGSCNINCQNVPGCTTATCTYNDTLDKCVENINAGICDLPVEVVITTIPPFSGIKTCNNSGKWEIDNPASCPTGWTRTPGNHCTQDGTVGDCSLCDTDLNCIDLNSTGRCVSDKLCPDKDATCIGNPLLNAKGDCIVEIEPSCECCCRINNAKEDCCAGLDCSGKCGSDIINNSNTYGSCSGCASIGTSTLEHDLACNCTGHTSQFCDVTAANPTGICVDCSQISSQESCGDHSSACCFDANRTATTTDDVCRGLNGGTVVSNIKSSPNYGYCSYFNCQVLPDDPLVCASTTPVKIGFFNNVNTCIGDCPKGIGNDPCRAFDDNEVPCAAESRCCYDTTTTHCLSGNQIEGGDDDGHCAYYACETPPNNPLLCNFTPTTTPGFISTSSCAIACANPPGGAGLGCINPNATSTCNLGLCNFPGFACLKEEGGNGSYPDCGTCCCQPAAGTTPDSCISSSTPTLHCQTDKGSCTGANRGLCCGCTNDSDCGSISTTGCGLDACCQARPSVTETLPLTQATDVCRNAALKVTFNQNMDLTSFSNNFILFEERAYGNGVCPAGTFLTDARTIEEFAQPKTKNIFARLWQNINLKLSRLFGQVNDQALAVKPDPSKLYCSIPGVASAEETGSQTNLIFYPSKLLSPAAKYYAVVKGDESLDSQTGVLSFAKIGMNERGLKEGNNPESFIPSAEVQFNGRAYFNSYSFQFTTLSDQGVNAGICAVDHVGISPASYLFKTTTNDLNEKDNNMNDSTFDTVSDSDKVFSSAAYSADNQLIHPVRGYNWNWAWSMDSTSTAKILNITPNLPENRKLVSANQGISDGQTKVNATVNMDNFRPNANCGSDCNSYFIGDGETKASDIYVFVCDNPWPIVNPLGEWSPWEDADNNCSINNQVNCINYNYKFYYCRDAGAAGTLDDLPAIISSPVINGQGSNLLCSSDKTPCTVAPGDPCGKDQNGDGVADGVCLWNILKESYFFREAILPGGEIVEAIDAKTNGEVRLTWSSPASGVGSYKIYYLKSGKGTMFMKEVATSACVLSGQVYNCNTKIGGLINNQPYVFKLTVISTNKTESPLSNEKTATPTDQSRPTRPSGLESEVATSTIKFSWLPNPAVEGVSFYRLYRGIASGSYGESFDSAINATSLTFNRNQFTPTLNYFVLTAVNASNHESTQSREVVADLREGLPDVIDLFNDETVDVVDLNKNR